MSGSSRRQLSVSLEAQDRATEIWVLDSRFRIVAHDVGWLHQQLDPGIYKVRATAGSAVWEQVVVLEGRNLAVQIPVLGFASPAPLPQTALSHEYHEEAVEQESRRVHVDAGQGSAIFLFLRRWTAPDALPAQTHSGQHPALGLTLCDARGALVADLATQSACYASPARDGWSACTVRVDPGPYRLCLELPDGTGLEQPLIAAPGWVTQLFGLQRRYGTGPEDERADLPGASIIYRRFDAEAKDGFIWFGPLDYQEERKSWRLSELARQGLMDRRQVLPRDVTEMLWDKWQNPILGIYGAHLMLLQEEPNWQLFGRVIHNLRGIFGGYPHPDVEALALCHEATARRDYRFEFPPMLRRSWSLLQEATFAQPGLVPSGSLALQVSDRLWGGSPWHLWRAPVQDLPPLLAAASRGPAGARPPLLDDYDVAILTQLQAVEEPDAVPFWDPALAGRILQGITGPDPQLPPDEDTLRRLMDVLGLPRVKVEERLARLHEKAQLYESVRSEMPSGADRTWELEKVVAQVREIALRGGDVGAEVGALVAEDSDGSRLTALGILQARPDPAFFALVKDAIEASRSAFEQYHALMAARAMLPLLDNRQKLALHDALVDQRSGGEEKWITPGTDRWVVSARILDWLSANDSWAVAAFRPIPPGEQAATDTSSR
jgi:hypothetical protein